MDIRDRVKEFRRVRAGDIAPNPKNWREHPKSQRRVLSDVLEKIGYADVLITRERKDGSLELIDGHLRASLNPEQTVPVIVVDLDDAEADLLLASVDSISTLAETNTEKFNTILESGALTPQSLNEMFYDMSQSAFFSELRDITGEPTERDIRKSFLLTIVLSVEQSEIFEEAIALTENRNRGEAIIEVCRNYVEKRQSDVAEKSHSAVERAPRNRKAKRT